MYLGVHVTKIIRVLEMNMRSEQRHIKPKPVNQNRRLPGLPLLTTKLLLLGPIKGNFKRKPGPLSTVLLGWPTMTLDSNLVCSLPLLLNDISLLLCSLFSFQLLDNDAKNPEKHDLNTGNKSSRLPSAMLLALDQPRPPEPLP